MKTMTRLMTILAAVLLMAGATLAPARAATIVLDPAPTDTEGFFRLVGPSGSNVTFTLTHNADVNINLLALGFGGVNFSLAACTNALCTTSTGVPGTPTLNSLGAFVSTAEFSYSALSAGTKYLLSITGVAGLVLGSLTAQVAATPIPAALLMFLTALGGLGFMAKWRKPMGVSAAAV